MNKKIIIIITLIATLGLLTNYLINNFEDFKSISIASPSSLALLIILTILLYFSIGKRLDVLTETFEIKLSLLEAFKLSLATGFYNLITPLRGGTLIRAAYLKKKHNLNYKNFLASFYGMYVLTFLIAGLVGFSSLALLGKIKTQNYILSIIFLSITILMSIIIIFSPKPKNHQNKILNSIIKLSSGWHKISKNKKTILLGILTTLSNFLIISLMMILEFKIFGIKINLLTALVLASINSLSVLISITPGSLGIKEATLVLTASALGIPTSESIAVSILDRAIQTLTLFTLGPIFSYELTKKTKLTKK